MKMSSFKSKTKLQNFIKDKLRREYNDGDRISHGSMFELLNDLVDNYYDTEWLRGVGIEYFYVAQCSVNKRNKNFNVMRLDGTSDNFSYYKAINGNNQKDEIRIKRAFRMVVIPFTDNFKKEFFANNQDSRGYIKCPLSGIKTTIKNCHVDHAYPRTFDSLFYTYINNHSLDINSIAFDNSGRDDRPVLTDSNLIKSFYEWHERNAILRCVYWRANLQFKKNNKSILNLNN